MDQNRPIPHNEDERIKALQSYNVLDSLGEEAYDRITQLASVICEVPIALVSLIDSDRQWFKSKVGIDVTETERSISFCQHAIMSNEIFEIENAIDDIRFKDNPLVQGFPNIRFYAGFPLEDPNGYNLGTLCVIDEKPHKLNDTQRLALTVLGKEVVAQLVAKKNALELVKFKELFDLSIDIIGIANLEGYFKSVNEAFSKAMGWSKEELYSKPFFEFIHPEDREKTELELEKLKKGNKTFNFVCRCISKDDTIKFFQWVINPDIKSGNLYAIARDITESYLEELRNNERLLKSEKQSEILSKISTSSTTLNQTKKTITNQLTECLSEGLNVNRVGLWLFEEEILVCNDLYDSKHGQHNSGLVLHPSTFPIYYSHLLEGKPIVASNAHTNKYTSEFSDIYLRPNNINSMLDVPVWKDGTLIGVLCSESSEEDRIWLDSDISFARTIADTYALKISEYERKETEKIALKTSRRLEKLLTNFQEAVLLEDENRHIVIANQMFCDLFHIPAPAEVLVGMDCSESAEQSKGLFKEPEKFVSTIDTILKNKQKVKDETLEMTNGKILERDYVPIYIDEVYTGHLWKYRDVTESKRIAQELEIAKNELKVTFDTITEGVVVQAANLEIINCNPAACRILKMSEDQMRGKTSLDPDWNAIKEDGTPFPGEEHPAALAIKTGKSIYNTIMGVRIHHGEVTWININVELFPDKQGLVCSFSDITERKEIEDNKLRLVALEASNKVAEDTLKAREEFLANMSHEIRTPMNSIIGLSNLMDKAGSLNEKQRSYLDVIQLNSDNLLNIINDILDYSKLESGKFELEKIDCNLPEMINNIVSSMQVLADHHNLKIHTELDSKLPSFIKGDALRMSQIITNLLSNAIKFSERKDIHVKLLVNSISEKFVTYTIQIIDQGIGISKDKISDILKPFTQESSSTTRKYGGTGLGLSIVSSLLNYMGSSLEIDSTPGKGSIFSFTLEQEIGNKILKASNLIEKLTGKYYILLVEDNQFNQLVAIDTLMDWNPNFEIQIANNGLEALACLNESCFDIVLMDIQMPLMDGYTATKEIRNSTEHYKNTPIVAMTAHASSMEVEKCLNIGMNAYLSKPFNQNDLFERVAAIIYDEKREILSTNLTSTSEIEKQNSSMTSGSIVDVEAILNFTKGKIDRIEKMIDMFINDTPNELELLQQYFDSKDYNSLRSLAHSFKPKYTYMGMPKLSEVAKKIEHNAIDMMNDSETSILIKQLKTDTKLAFDELTHFLQDLKKI